MHYSCFYYLHSINHLFPIKKYRTFVSMIKKLLGNLLLLLLISNHQVVWGQFVPKNITEEQRIKANHWVEKTYQNMSQDERLGQLFIIALYTNKGDAFIQNVRNIVEKEQIGGLILMQDDASKEISLVNELHAKSKIPLLIGMDAEWGLYQRIPIAHKFPWAITLGAIQNKQTIYENAKKIAQDAKRMGVNWNFAPVVDVNTNPKNPIIGNRSFGSTVENVTQSAYAYTMGLQDQNILAAIKHFPGHGDTSTDSHLTLPVVHHSLDRLQAVELAPFQNLINKGIGGVMVAHVYVPTLEKGKNIPASLSYSVVTELLKKQMGYQGLIITDALNMNAVADTYPPGVVDALAFKAGNDIMLFSQDVAKGKAEIQKAIDRGEIPAQRVEESVKKILKTKYFLGLSQHPETINPQNIHWDLKTEKHRQIIQNAYSEAVTLLKDDKNLLPLKKEDTYYYLPLEEAPLGLYPDLLQLGITLKTIEPKDIPLLPQSAKVIIGIHKDNSTAYKPYTISKQNKTLIHKIAEKHPVLLHIFGSPYALADVEIKNISTVVVAYENNDDAVIASVQGLLGKKPINGRLPVTVNHTLPAGSGITKNETK